jgi:hypothetical protein
MTEHDDLNHLPVFAVEVQWKTTQPKTVGKNAKVAFARNAAICLSMNQAE